ncbi:tyrosine--tRNA ligase, mitochondrial [Myzus persicae]|uniref:tyrosine--tRNA ligase, mitochondrial n=1 Tax=Myzus persicae TaxID=13164 RepID=UPI000B930EED|nr:tyrosine--tRNA ligase, mitochondrial [Myzus persicae]XP_022180292.1 tyrosine--tRNA ligase, mitochondrial [Myzus persicae]XP_022180293.1 tyrosine--tRNA ligase, mitochondrial [Myzus persicae]
MCRCLLSKRLLVATVGRIYDVSHSHHRIQRFYSNRNVLKLYERQIIQNMFPDNSSNEIIELLTKRNQCVYAGFDPTADSLHIGNLLVIINLLHWQRANHKVIALIGGATAQIGDPSGKSKDRDKQSSQTLSHNIKGITHSLQSIFDNHAKYFWKQKDPLPEPIIINNMEWYEGIGVIDFMNNIGRHFRMGTMLSRDSVKTRLSGSGMSFTEFTYQTFQAYDWLHLFKKYKCCFQLGGNDQMGNIMSGQELISRQENAQVYGLTVPLITTDSGDKYGKSAQNAVWLNSDRTSPFELYQFMIRTIDADVEKLLKMFTFLSLPEIAELMRRHKATPDKRIPHESLARQVTTLVHGEEGLQEALVATSALYDNNIETLSTLSVNDILKIFNGATVVELMLEPGITVLKMAMNAKCFLTDRDAYRIISAGGFYINHQRITNIDEIVTLSIHILPNNISLVRVGKRNYWIVKWIM